MPHASHSPVSAHLQNDPFKSEDMSLLCSALSRGSHLMQNKSQSPSLVINHVDIMSSPDRMWWHGHSTSMLPSPRPVALGWTGGTHQSIPHWGVIHKTRSRSSSRLQGYDRQGLGNCHRAEGTKDLWMSALWCPGLAGMEEEFSGKNRWNLIKSGVQSILLLILFS